MDLKKYGEENNMEEFDRMEQRIAKITYNKSGRGTLTPKITLPISWTKIMELSPEDREVVISFDGEQIKIKKAGKTE